MIENIHILKIDHYIRLVIKRRWFIFIPLAVAITAGIYLALTLPRVYVAKTLILVEAQRVPTNFVQSLVSIDINSRISTISQQIMSRTNLEKIIQQFSLYTEPEYQKMYMEDKVEDVRKRIAVNVTRARDGADAFSISFKGKDPEKVMKIANTLATFFINENLKVREAQAIGTSSFLDDELEVMRKKLVSVEEALKDYRREHMGELPEQLETNLRSLDRLQLELGEKEESLRSAKNRIASVENEIQAMREAPTQLPQTTGRRAMENGAAESPEPTELEQQYYELKKQLSLMRTRYTERHPDIVKLKRIVTGLEARVEAERNIAKKTPRPESVETAVPPSQSDENNVDFDTLNQKDAISREIDALNDDIAKLRQEIAEINQRVENTPKREQELLTLNRDYSNIQAQYSSLLSRKLEAEIAVNMERKQKGEQFRILDPARLPEKPSEPDMKKLFLLTLAVGLGLGGGVVFLFDFFDTSFKTSTDVESVIGVPILAMVPTLPSPGDTRRSRVRLILTLFSLAVILGLLSGFATLTFKGVDQTKAFVGKYIRL